MKANRAHWLWTLAVGLGLLTAGSAQAFYDTTNYARIHDWHDQGCRMYPGGPGAAASGADQAGGNQAHCTVCGGAGGRAAWTVDEPYLNLFVTDEPLSYTCSSGQPMTFRFLYRQRYTMPQPDECPNYYWPGQAPPSRGTQDPYLVNLGILGNGMRDFGMTNACWGHNWLMDMQFWDHAYEAGQSQTQYSSYEAWVWRPEGGIYYSLTNVSGPAALLDAQSRARIQPLSALGRPTANTAPTGTDGINWGEPATNGFGLFYPDGSEDVLSLCVCPSGTGATTTHAFLTKRIDPQGRVTRLGYEWALFTNYWKPQLPPYVASYAVWRVRYVVDPDGRTNVFTYHTNVMDGIPDHAAQHAWQVVEIDDPYGRKTLLNYDTYAGLLTSIVDGAGLTNSFTYLSPSGWMASLTTPYGTTSFTYTESTGQTNGVNQRALLATEPQNAYQLYCYWHNSQTFVSATTTNFPSLINSTFDTGSVGTNCPQLYYRNSFYWDRRQTAAFPTNFYTALQGLQPSFATALTYLATADYERARLRHWLWGADGISLTDSLSSERDPRPDSAGTTEGARTWYDYANKPSPEVVGDAQVGCVARVLPGTTNTTAYIRYNYWPVGYPYFGGLLRDNESSYSLANGTVGVRTNWYYFTTDGIDLVSIVNSFGQRVDLGYDNTNHQATSITNVLGQVSQIGYNTGTRNLTSVVLASGQTVTPTYYASASPPTSTSSLLQSLTLQPQGLLVQIADYANGLPRVVTTSGPGLPQLTVTNSWDGLNRLTGTAFPDGTTTSNLYDRLYLGAAKDRRDKWTHYGYDALEHLTTITDPLGNLTTLDWCGCGALNSITDALLTNSTSFGYNNQGVLTSILFPDNSSVGYIRDNLGRVTQAFDGTNRTLSYGYNNQGLLTTVSNAYGLLSGVVYDAADRPSQVTDANNVTVTWQFDLLNRLTNRIWPDTIAEGFGWATNGLVAYTNRNGKVTRYARDGASRLTGVTNANQEITQLRYNCLSQVTNLYDGRNNLTAWNYDAYGWLLNKVDALGHEVQHLRRDANGQITNRWTPQFGDTRYAWNDAGNLKTISNSPQSVVSFTYDPDNRLQTMADALGTTTFGYTPAGKLQSETSPWLNLILTNGYIQGLRTVLSVNALSFGYGYDSAWRLFTLDSPAGEFAYGYDAQRSTLPTLLALPNAAWITNHYDSLARLDYTALANQWGHALDGYAYAYDYLSLRKSIARDLGLTNSSVTVGYDAIGQLTSWQAKEGTNGLARLNEQFGFGFDQAGNLRSRTNGGLVQTFTNDVLNQLTNITRNNTLTVSGVTPAPASSVTVNGQTAQTYGDFTFARTNVTLSNGNNAFTNIAQNACGTRVTNTINSYLPSANTCLFDSNGNLTNDGTRSFSYDAENRLLTNWVASAWKSEFVYDGLGRRRIERDYGWQGSKWAKTNETRYVYDGYLAIQERDSNNVARVTYTRGLDLSASLAGAGGIGGLLARTDGNGSTFYHADGAGNITALMDGQQNMAARYMYGAFGRLVGKWGPMADANTMQFSSMPTHRQSGLSLYPFRAYDPSLQRFINRDPIGERGGINLYGFARNNPLAWIDPLGLDNMNPTQEEINANSINNGPVNIVLTLTPIMQPTPPVLSAQGSSVVRQPEEVPTGRYLLSSEYGGDDPLIQYALWAGGNAAMLLATEFLGEAAPAWLARAFKAKCPPKLMYHYTTAEESSFANGLWRESSVTDKLYTDPLQASQELGIPVPNKVIPIQDAGQFVPNKPSIVQPSFRFQGGGTDFINPQPVPPSQLLPAQPIGR